MTNKHTLSLLFLIIVTIVGCGIARQVATLQEEAELEYTTGNYSDALNLYEQVIEMKMSRNREISGETWYRAGIAAWETELRHRAIEYLVNAGRKDYYSEEGYYILAKAYREIDNLSLEITNLRNYLEKYPDGRKADDMRIRLFDTYLETNNHEGALELWQYLENMASGNPDILENWFILNSRLDREEKLKDIALKLYNADNKNVIAIEYLGDHYFWIAESRYQEEMKAYEENHTRRQYRQLLSAMDTINEQFRLSRDYFEQLMDIDPKPVYAEYLRNIYKRFGNKERADYYHQRSLEL